MSDIRLQNGALSTTQVGAYNVYTGARYVPLIAGEWDSTKNYEPLTIVINQGNSYTSAQYVPAGVPLQTNGPYWFLTGNFNSQVALIEETVESNTNSINSINSSLTEIEGDIEDLKYGTDKYWILLADSWGDTTGSQGGIRGWTSYISEWLEEGSYEIHQQGGTGFSITPSYWSLAQQVTAENRTKVTDVLVETAFNDGPSTNEQITTAMNQFITNCKSIFPNVKRFHVFPCLINPEYIKRKNWYYNSLLTNEFGDWLFPQYWIGYCHFSAYLNPDLYHLTTAGYNDFAHYVYNYMCGNPTFPRSLGGNVNQFNTWIEGNLINWRCRCPITVSSSQSTIDLVTLTTGQNCCIIAADNNYNEWIGTVTVYQNGEIYTIGYIQLNANKIQLITQKSLTAGSYTTDGIGYTSLIYD